MKVFFKNSSLLVIISFFINAPVFSQAQLPPEHTYKIIKGEDEQKNSIQYFHDLLSYALTITNKEYGSFKLQTVPFNYSQNRTLKLLSSPDVLDVTYSMTSTDREKEFTAIKIPLLDGLFSKRMLLVKAADKEKFEVISQTELKNLIACQGLHWPDLHILQKNGYKVYGVTEFDSNFKMLMKGRCDYLPRSIQEIDHDFKKFNTQYGPFAKVDSVLLQYSAPVYFFVGKHNMELAERLTKGLKQLQQKGEIKKLLMKNKYFNYNKPIGLNSTLKVFQLSNH